MNSKKLNSDYSLAFIGLGSIGLPIAAKLISEGFNLHIHSRNQTEERQKKLKGSKSFSSPKQAAKGCNSVLICVSDDLAVENVIFGQKGILDSLNSGDIVLDLSTISPSKARSCAYRLAKNGSFAWS